MSPGKFPGDHQAFIREINGPRPSPLKINKQSHLVKKLPAPAPAMAQQHRHPVIIYTHSPKIIHTQPRDFMALVQKLTGCSGSNDGGDETAPSPSPQPVMKKMTGPVPYFSDIPVFTPNSTSFYTSPRASCRFPDSVFLSPNMRNSMSPSVFEFIKEFPES